MHLQARLSNPRDFGIVNNSCRVVETNQICRWKINQSLCTVNTVLILHARQGATYLNSQEPLKVSSLPKVILSQAKQVIQNQSSLNTSLKTIFSQINTFLMQISVTIKVTTHSYCFPTARADSTTYTVRYFFWLFTKFLSVILGCHWIIIMILHWLF